MKLPALKTSWLVVLSAAVLFSALGSTFLPQQASALSSTGPEDGNVRYALENSTTTQATTMQVPIYFRNRPGGTVWVRAHDFIRGSNTQVSFNGGGNINSTTDFGIPASSFNRDSASGWYKATINADMRNYSGQQWYNYIHFRLSLLDGSGYIGYGGGRFQQASRDYYNTNPARTYSLHLATPCDISSNQTRNVLFYDLDNRNPDNGGRHLWLNIYDETTGRLVASRDGDRDGGMGQGGTLSISMTFEPLHKYRVDIHNVSSNNVIQYNFPYDNIAYAVSCSWTVSGSSTLNGRTGTINNVAVGTDLNWTHRIRNEGPNVTTERVVSNIGLSGFTNGWSSGRDGGSTGPGVGDGVLMRTMTSSYRVGQNDVGNTLCQWAQWDPVNSSGARDGRGNRVCADVPYDYALIPTITNINDGSMSEAPTGPIPVQGNVRNTGPTKSHPNIQWQITQVRYNPGVSIARKSGGVSSSNPCAFFIGNNGCTSLSSGTEVTGYSSNANRNYTGSGGIGDVPVGTNLCFAMSVRRNSDSSTDWRHSQLHCITIGKKPKVQVYGGDLIVGRGYGTNGAKINSNVTTSVANKNGTYYGSWGEYGIIPSGTVSGMASGSGLAGGVGTNNLCGGLSLLTFANATNATSPTCSNANIGRYSLSSSSQLNAIMSRFAVTGGAPSQTGNVDVNNLTSATIYSGTGTINLSSSADMPVGKWVVINAPGATVNITSNLRYTNAPLTRATDIPQLVIIAQNINIADSVEQVDAWLFAAGTGTNGSLRTCTAGVTLPTQLTASVCDRKLTVNGPVIANHLYMYRTAGSGVGPASGDPAEVFNLRPDAYMWASSFSGNNSKARTVYQTELPPRF